MNRGYLLPPCFLSLFDSDDGYEFREESPRACKSRPVGTGGDGGALPPNISPRLYIEVYYTALFNHSVNFLSVTTRVSTSFCLCRWQAF